MAHLVEVARSAGNMGGKKGKVASHVAFGFDVPVFKWYSDPAQVWQEQQMSLAMQQLHRMANGNVVAGTHQLFTLHNLRKLMNDTLLDFDWCVLNGPVVDVGSGIGALEMVVMKTYPDTALPFIIFDNFKIFENVRKV